MARTRLTHDDYQHRLADYCARYGVEPGEKGFPPYPAGRRETPQHRAWMALHRLHDRLSRRDRGQCQRCPEPAVDGGLHCIPHSAAGGASLDHTELRTLHVEQKRACPVCEKPLDVLEARLYERPGEREREVGRALVHSKCLHLITLIEAAGPGVLIRLRRLLGPENPAMRQGAS